MNTKDKFCSGCLWRFCIPVLAVFSCVIALFLAYYSAFFSYYPRTDDSETTFLIPDSPLSNLLVFIAAAALVFGLEYLLNKIPEYRESLCVLFLGICALLFLIIGWVWTGALPYYPSGDQLNATAAAYYHLDGDFSMLQSGGYIGIYSQQKGLVLLYEILFSLFGDFSYGKIAKLYVISGVLVMILGFFILKDFSTRCIYRVIYCLCVLFCAPYIILMPYSYGDIPSIFYSMLLFWALERYGSRSQRRYVCIACFAAILALFNRQNSWIILIAAAIGLFLLALEKRSLRPIFVCACILLSCVIALKALNLSYELRSGYEDTHGTPASLYFAMGMQDGINGPGTYNRFNQGTYESVDFDREEAARIGWETVRSQMNDFRQNPEYASDFYLAKIQLQWIEPLFETLISTNSFPEDAVFPDWIYEIYYGKLHNILFNLSDLYQSIIYLAFLAYAALLFCKRQPAATYIPLIAIVGGFLFSIIWEAQGRYVLPYYMFMLLYVPIGLCNLCDAVVLLFQKLIPSRKLPKEQDSDTRDSMVA